MQELPGGTLGARCGPRITLNDEVVPGHMPCDCCVDDGRRRPLMAGGSRSRRRVRASAPTRGGARSSLKTVVTRQGMKRGSGHGAIRLLHLTEVALVARLARMDLSTPYQASTSTVTSRFRSRPSSMSFTTMSGFGVPHTRPFWETHIVVVPKRHIASFTSATSSDEQDMRALFSAVQRVARGVETAKGAAAVLTNLGVYGLEAPPRSRPQRTGTRSSMRPPSRPDLRLGPWPGSDARCSRTARAVGA